MVASVQQIQVFAFWNFQKWKKKYFQFLVGWIIKWKLRDTEGWLYSMIILKLRELKRRSIKPLISLLMDYYRWYFHVLPYVGAICIYICKFKMRCFICGSITCSFLFTCMSFCVMNKILKIFHWCIINM